MKNIGLRLGHNDAQWEQRHADGKDKDAVAQETVEKAQAGVISDMQERTKEKETEAAALKARADAARDKQTQPEKVASESEATTKVAE